MAKRQSEAQRASMSMLKTARQMAASAPVAAPRPILPTQNEEWGVWGAAGQAGLAQPTVWRAMFEALLDGIEGITPDQVRFALDARWGRHAVDSLSFLSVPDQSRPAAIYQHMLVHLSARADRTLFATLEQMDSCDTSKLRRRHLDDKPADEPGRVVLDLARKHFGVETLRERGGDSLDIHEAGVWSIEAALRAAYEAGRASR
jgi:hypothetical protein